MFALGAGVDTILADPTLARSLPLVRLRDAGLAAQMVDYHVYAALHFQRDFDLYLRDQATATWRARAPRTRRMRVGVLGLGVMGGAVARALVGMGFRVTGWSRRPKTLEGVEVLSGADGLDACLRRSELLVCLLPHTRETDGLLDARRLASLPRGAAIVNAGRGSLLDEAGLLELLDSGHLRGAFLDVTASEPLPSASRLWRHPAVRVTPHVAAATLIEPAVDQVAEAIAALEAGQRPAGLVDRSAGY